MVSGFSALLDGFPISLYSIPSASPSLTIGPSIQISSKRMPAWALLQSPGWRKMSLAGGNW